MMESSKMKTFKDIYPTLPPGWLTEAEAECLWTWTRLAEGPILEVGCYKGRSTCLLAATGRRVYAVDPFRGFDSDDPTGDGAWVEFLANLASREIGNVRLFKVDVRDWDPRPVGFAYLDGDHTYEGTRTQIRVAQACKADVIAAHDVNDSGGGLEVKRACYEMLGEPDDRVERLAVWDVLGRGL